MMNRQLFMRDLARFLSDLPVEEREQALKYYEDYFEDAGPENEQKVIKELGSPVDVARQIKTVNKDQISYGEGSARKDMAAPKVMQGSGAGNTSYTSNTNSTGNASGFYGGMGQTAPENSSSQNWTQNPGKITLVIILAILAIPVGLPLICSLFGVAIAVIACLFSLFIGLFAMGGALVFSGGAGIVCAIFSLVGGHYASSILALGFSLILISVGLFLLWLGILFCSKGIPAVWKGTTYCCRSIAKGIKHFFS